MTQRLPDAVPHRAAALVTSPPPARSNAQGLTLALAACLALGLAGPISCQRASEAPAPLPPPLPEPAPRAVGVKAETPAEAPATEAATAPPGDGGLAAGEAAALPAGATPGDVLAAPRPARRLALASDAPKSKAGVPLHPELPCDQLAPDPSDRLGQRVDIELAAPVGEEAPHLELCLFHRSTARGASEVTSRTGRRHTFVAAFPGRQVVSWAADELADEPATLPADAAVTASGWATLLATGIEDTPALAIASARFYDGAHAEVVRTRRVGRVLSRKGGKWTWRPLAEVTVDSLDLDFIDARCKATPEAEGCAALLEQAAAWRQAADERDERRGRRLLDEAAAVPKGGVEGDPQSEWLRRGRAALRAGKPIDAVQAALHVELLCGEAVVEARKLYAEAAALRGDALQVAAPRPKSAPLCEPMADRGGPARK